jgi:hypothetical protein
VSNLHKLLIGKQVLVKVKIPKGVDTSQPGTYPAQIVSVKEIEMANSNLPPAVDSALEILAGFLAADIVNGSEASVDAEMVVQYVDSLELEEEIRERICKLLNIKVPD